MTKRLSATERGVAPGEGLKTRGKRRKEAEVSKRSSRVFSVLFSVSVLLSAKDTVVLDGGALPWCASPAIDGV